MQNYLVRGSINFPGLMKVPSANRIPALSQADFTECMKSVNSAVYLFLSTCGVEVNTSVAITSSILNEAHEDNLSIEDVVMFLMKMTAGQYGKFYGNITPPAFMEKFEEYRQERHEALLNIREEKSANHKALGPSEREYDKSPDQQRQAVKDLMDYHFKKDQANS